MDLIRVDRLTSPRGAGLVRLRGHVRTDAGLASEWWIDVPEALAPDLTASGDPWLAWLLPAAAASGEPLRLCLPVDALHLERSRELLEIWRLWHPALSVIDVRAEVRPSDPPRPHRRTVALFSGGVDSLFTALRPRPAPIDDLLLVQGSIDLPLTNAARVEEARESAARIARGLGRTLLAAATNAFENLRTFTDVKHHAFGSGFAGILLALEPRFDRALFPASLDARWLHAWGTHPLTDVLHSTTRLRIDVDGVGVERHEKTAALVAASERDLVLADLRVCLRAEAGGNCSRCEKCLRTMLTLELIGAARHAPTFDFALVGPRAIAGLRLRGDEDRAMYEPLLALARERGRPDLASAVTAILGRSHRRDALDRWSLALLGMPLLGPLWDRVRAPLRRLLTGEARPGERGAPVTPRSA